MVRKKKLLWEPEVLPIFRQLTDALSYTHRKGIAHRDIKLENVMFTSSNQSNSVRLCDFGLAAQLSRSLVRPSDRQSTQISHVKSGEVSSDDYDCLKSECGSELYVSVGITASDKIVNIMVSMYRWLRKCNCESFMMVALLMFGV